MAKAKGKVANNKKKGGQAPKSGLDELLGVLVAAVAMLAAAGAALGRSARLRLAAAGSGAGAGAGAAVVPVRPAPAKPAKGIKAKLRAAGDRWSILGRALDVQERYSDLNGNNMAAAVTFQAFVSIFPLLLVAVAVVGIVAGQGTDVAGRVISELGLTGDARSAVTDAIDAAEGSKQVAGPIGIISLLWSGLGLVNALQYAYNQVWQVEARGLKDKAVGLLWLGGAVVLFVAAAAITTALQWLPGGIRPIGVVVALAVNFSLWVWTSKILPNTHLPWRAVIPGSILATIGFEVLKVVGGIYVPRAVASSSQLYGALGVVFAILAWLFFFGRLIVYSAVVNVVLWEKEVGTVRVVTDVPAQPGADRGEQVSRTGRLQDA
ncbi:MAG: YihY/virulence factor BrkB family protein [Actinobacteria bacterium]|nr:YihY/virulence factor BrkB family protein [Actinomycetota bacterium]MBW3649778.1 YihY/virulence factor BrkB family protein [Actinomycetota bacterium]